MLGLKLHRDSVIDILKVQAGARTGAFQAIFELSAGPY
jgi:hypothetical protein